MSLYETIEEQQQSPIEFERVPEQCVKGNDVVACFKISKEIEINEENDRVALMRVCTLSFPSEYPHLCFISFSSDWYN